MEAYCFGKSFEKHLIKLFFGVVTFLRICFIHNSFVLYYSFNVFDNSFSKIIKISSGIVLQDVASWQTCDG